MFGKGIDIADKLFDIADELADKLYRFAEQLKGSGMSMSNNIAKLGFIFKEGIPPFLNIARRSNLKMQNLILIEKRKLIEPQV